MKEIDLFGFIVKDQIEYHWDNDDVYVFISHWNIKEFMDLFSINYLSDNIIECVLRDGYIVAKMKDICEWHDIELINVFPNKDR